MVNINLLPPELKQKIEEAKKSANVFSICLVVVIITGVLAFLAYATRSMLLDPELKDLRENITTSQAGLKSFKEHEEQALFLNDRATLADEIEKNRALWSQVVTELTNSVPKEVKFKSVAANMNKKPNFVLQGETVSEREIIKFKEKLENSTLFKNVAFKSSSRVTGEENNNLDFSLEFDFEQFKLSQDKERQ